MYTEDDICFNEAEIKHNSTYKSNVTSSKDPICEVDPPWPSGFDACLPNQEIASSSLRWILTSAKSSLKNREEKQSWKLFKR